jgi:transposase
MKRLILLISFLILSWNTFSQTATTQPLPVSSSDTTQVCLPAPIAREVAKDLLRYDGCKEEIKLLLSKIDKIQDISKVKDAMIAMHEDKDKNNAFIIQQLEEQVNTAKKMSDDLHKELKGQRSKSFLWKAGTFLGVIASSYLLITK